MENKKWKILEQDNSNLIEIANKLSIDKDIVKLLVNRGITSEDEINLFVNGKIEDISDPFLLEDITKATDRLLLAINNKEKICVYGDYDVDGITSVTLVVLALRKLGVNIDYYIPLREEGYGLNKEAIKKLKEENEISLLITVDCGITSVKEIDYANEIGLDVIVTDHHEIQKDFFPNAYAVINPKREENKYSFKFLAGVGTVFMLMKALYKIYEKEDDINTFIDIVAIGTIADIVPLVSDNRLFAKFGLEKLNNTTNLGIKILLQNIFEDYSSHKFTSGDIGFRVGPIFNASGRIEDAKSVVEILLSEDENFIKTRVIELISRNKERQNLEKAILEKTKTIIEEAKLYEKNIIIVSDKEFHHGVIGIVASKIVDKYYKPTIICEEKENGVCVCSARSIEGISIIHYISEQKDLLIKFGGHDMASGFSILKENLEKFYKNINKDLENINKDIYIETLKVDSEILPYKINMSFYNSLESLFPFGCGNPTPKFVMRGVSFNNMRKIGAEKTHLMFDINYDFNNTINKLKNSVWFGKADVLNELKENKKYDVVFKIESNFYNGAYSAKVQVDDVRISNYNQKLYTYYKGIFEEVFPKKTIVKNIESKNEIILKANDICEIDFNNSSMELPIKVKGNCVGYLEKEISLILRELNEGYNKNFYFEYSKEESNNIIGEIKLSYKLNLDDFNNHNKIMNSVKDIVLPTFNYNYIQKECLKAFFKRDNNIIITTEHGRGIKTLILSLGMYFYYRTNNKKCIIVGNSDNFTEEYYRYFDIIDIEDDSIHKYPLAIYYFTEASKFNPNSNIIITDNIETKIKGFENIKDVYNIQNITIVDTVNENNIDIDKFYSHIYPEEYKQKFKSKINNKESFIATNKIKALL